MQNQHHNKIYALDFLLRWESQKSTELSVFHKCCLIMQTAINPINFILLFNYGELNTVFWTKHLISNYFNDFKWISYNE